MTWSANEGREDVPAETRDHEQPELNSNTEGKIRSLELKIVLDQDSTALQPGERVYVSGHFEGRPRTESATTAA
jgi:hypothetical protein